MEELKLMAQTIQNVVDDNMAVLKKMEDKKGTNMYDHKLGEISAYNDVVTMILLRINLLEKEGKN